MKVETLTPVHVGSGDKYLAIDFVIKGDRVILIDSLKFFQEVERRGLDPIDVAEKIARQGKSVEDFVDDIIGIKTAEIPFTGRIQKNEILRHMQYNGNLYIPGSSIKGAIRTALLWKEVKEDRRLLEKAIQHIKSVIGGKRYIKGSELTKLDDKLEELVFRKSKLTSKRDDPKNDLLRALRLTDTSFFRKPKIYEIKFLGMGRFSVLAECIDCGDEAEVEIGLDEYVLQFMDQKIDLDAVLMATREFAEEIVNTEISRSYPEKAKNEFKSVLKAKGIILRVGWGTGWYSSTIGTLLKTHPEFETLRRKLGLGRNPRTGGFSKDFPAIRRVTFDDKPLGWIAIHD